MKVTAIGIDLAKSVFQVHGIDARGHAVLRKKLTRAQLIPFLATLPVCQIGIEACGGAHYWAREFQKLGHSVKMISPQFVKPYVKSNKTDAADAEAICEAMSRPHMRFVPIKQIEQQDIQSLHRVRQRLVRARTALSNEIRGLLHEYGFALPVGKQGFHKHILIILAATDETRLSSLGNQLLQELWQEYLKLQARIDQADDQLKSICKAHPVCERLCTIPGIGPLTATALLSAVSNPQLFRNGRELSAWLGLVPRQHSSGGKEKLLGISKRGDVYLRTLLIHGARSVLFRMANRTDYRSRWAQELMGRRGMNRAVVALANKNARIVWSVMARQEVYRPSVYEEVKMTVSA
jgi:transposase